MYMPLNPYERYEITGMSDEEREEERCQQHWNNYPDYEIDAIMEDLEEIFDGEF